MPPDDDGLQLAREAADEGLAQFRSTLAFYQSNPNPSATGGPRHGVPLPGMGTRPGIGGKPAPGTPPPPRGKYTPGQRTGPGNQTGSGPTSSGAKKPSTQAEKAWQRTAEQIALHEMMKARRDFVESLFKGASIQYKASKNPAKEALQAAKDFAKSAHSTAKTAKKEADEGRSWSAGGASTKPGAKEIKDAGTFGRRVVQVLGDIDASDLADLEGPIMELAGDIFTDLGSSLLPFVGTAKAGARATSKWVKTGKAQVKVKKTGAAQKVLIQGDPERAIEAVGRLLKRERNALAAEAGVATAKLGTDVAGYFVDLGIATGVATSSIEAIGRLTLKVRVLIRDARELKAGKAALNAGRLDADMFSACPLLGAYAVAAADTSALVGFLGGDPQRHGFTLADLEKLIRKHNESLVKNATDLILHSRLEVTGMPTDRATARAKTKGTDKGLKDRIARAVQQKLKMAAPAR